MFNIYDSIDKCIFGGALALVVFTPIGSAQAAHTESVLYSFCSQSNCSDGASPVAGLIADSSGNLYGTTSQGGQNCGCGVVFRLAPDGTETVLHAFNGSDGQYADSSLIMDGSGKLYGTTATGGGQGNCNQGCGVAFKIAPNGTETVLHAFSGGTDGGFPSGALIADKKGNLYGLTQTGGTGCGGFGCGVIFKLAKDGTETVLYSFVGGNDGISPMGNLIADKKGNLFGATYAGGTYNNGTVFKLAPDGTESVLYSFTGGVDGGNPYAGVIADKSGNLYGTTYYGGVPNYGDVFRIAPDGTETVLYAFCTQTNCTDGAEPEAGLTLDKKGNLYGTTYIGGTNNNPGNGTVFKLAPSGKETVLHSFDFQTSDGISPVSGLLEVNNTLFGTTPAGGANTGGAVYSLPK